jgi:uncharacterized protein YoxC
MDLFLSLFGTGWTLLLGLVAVVAWAVTAVITTRANTQAINEVTQSVKELSKSVGGVSVQIELTKKDVHQLRGDMKTVKDELSTVPNINNRLSKVEAQHAMLMYKESGK